MGTTDSGTGRAARRSGSPAPARELAGLPMADALLSRLVAARLRAAGVDLQRVLRSAGLTSRQIDNPDERLPATSQVAFLNEAAAALKDEFLGFRLAQDVDCRQLGLLYYVFASSNSLGEAIRRCARYSRVVNEAVVLHVVEGDPLIIRLAYAGVARHTDVQQMECIITFLLRICRQTTGRQLVPRRVAMMHVRSTVSPELAKFFGTKVEFGGEFDEIELPPVAGDLALIHADPYLNKIILENCEAILAQRRVNVGPIRIRVENAIAPLLPHASARADVIAKALGMSKRTLERKLAQEGASFAEILQQLKSEMAIRYVEDPVLPISHIAWLLGFEQVSSFNHAFKRWTGLSPRRMRSTDAGRRS